MSKKDSSHSSRMLKILPPILTVALVLLCNLYWKQDVDTGIDFLHALQCSPGCRRHPGSVCRQIAVGHLSAVGAVYRFCLLVW